MIQNSTSSIKEYRAWNVPGAVGVIACIFFGYFGYKSVVSAQFEGSSIQMILGVVSLGAAWLATTGFVIIQPLEARVVQLFGNYMGTIRETGLRWTLPLSSKKSISLRLRNFESPKLKVNEAEGNPIEIAAIVVWRIVDTAQASFNVDALHAFVEKQTESALRVLATKYPYDKQDRHTISLHENIDEVNNQLGEFVRQSLLTAGIQIVEARISLLAYAPEIAAAMLQRQQAQAIIAARQKIVDGAVGMVELALERLMNKGLVHLDEDRKAAMVSNLLVVLCSERPSQPVLNTGS